MFSRFTGFLKRKNIQEKVLLAGATGTVLYGGYAVSRLGYDIYKFSKQEIQSRIKYNELLKDKNNVLVKTKVEADGNHSGNVRFYKKDTVSKCDNNEYCTKIFKILNSKFPGKMITEKKVAAMSLQDNNIWLCDLDGQIDAFYREDEKTQTLKYYFEGDDSYIKTDIASEDDMSAIINDIYLM